LKKPKATNRGLRFWRNSLLMKFSNPTRTALNKARKRDRPKATGSMRRNIADKIDEVVFKMKDGRKVKVSEYGGGWTQYNVTRDEMLDSQFLDELWQLLYDYEFIESDY